MTRGGDGCVVKFACKCVFGFVHDKVWSSAFSLNFELIFFIVFVDIQLQLSIQYSRTSISRTNGTKGICKSKRSYVKSLNGLPETIVSNFVFCRTVESRISKRQLFKQLIVQTPEFQ